MSDCLLLLYHLLFSIRCFPPIFLILLISLNLGQYFNTDQTRALCPGSQGHHQSKMIEAFLEQEECGSHLCWGGGAMGFEGVYCVLAILGKNWCSWNEDTAYSDPVLLWDRGTSPTEGHAELSRDRLSLIKMLHRSLRRIISFFLFYCLSHCCRVVVFFVFF